MSFNSPIYRSLLLARQHVRRAHEIWESKAREQHRKLIKYEIRKAAPEIMRSTDALRAEMEAVQKENRYLKRQLQLAQTQAAIKKALASVESQPYTCCTCRRKLRRKLRKTRPPEH